MEKKSRKEKNKAIWHLIYGSNGKVWLVPLSLSDLNARGFKSNYRRRMRL